MFIKENQEIIKNIESTSIKLEIFEVNQKDKIQHIVQNSISIIIVFNLDNRESFENIGSLLTKLNTYKFIGDVYILGSSLTGFKTTCEEEVLNYLKSCLYPNTKYKEIVNYEEKIMKDFFDDVIQKSYLNFKSRKSSDVTDPNITNLKNCLII